MDGCLIRILLFLVPSIALADAANNEWYSTTRALSMGNAAVASAEDGATAMFYNPAALSRSKKVVADVFNPQVDVGTGVVTESGLSLAKHASLEKVRPLLEKSPGRVSSLGVALYPNISAQNFNFGILMSGQGASYYDGKNLHYRSRYLVIPSLGLSIGALGSRFRLGVAVRGVQATENDKNVVSSTAKGNGYTVDAGEGFGIGLDVGTLITMPWASLPTIGLVARNVGDTSFSGSAPAGVASGNVRPKDKEKMTYDAGFAIFPKIGRKSVFTFAVDYRDILNQSHTSTMRRINLGIEFSLSKILYLRTGFGRGYWTAGIGLASKLGSLDIGSYAEEMDASSFRAKEDRRISLRYGSRF